MVRAVTMPKLGQSEEEGTIVRWLKKEGDRIAKGDILFEIETDKALLEVESFFEGTLLKIATPEGQTVPVQATVGFIGEPGDPIPEVVPLPVAASKAETPRVAATPAAPPLGAKARPRVQSGRSAVEERLIHGGEKPLPSAASEAPEVFKISPRAARFAKEAAIDPSPIAGTGPGGRVVERDVKAYLEAEGYNRLRITPAAKTLAGRKNLDVLSLAREAGVDRITVSDVERALAERPRPMSRMRQAIAARLTESYTSTPHFFVTVSVDVTELLELREALKAQSVAYTVTDFILKAVALALVEFPVVNSTTDGKNLWWHSRVHLGLAVALDQGLLVPVIRKAEELTLAEIHTRAGELTAKARGGRLLPEEMSGSTFTVSNMGMMSVEDFTAIINPGEGAILAVSSALQQPVARDDRVVIRSMMKMTLSSDHRLIDGATAAQFLNAVKNKLEETSLWKLLA